MDDSDRKMWGTFILVGGVAISFALWRGALHYYGADKPGAAVVSPKAYEAMMEERVRQANERAEYGEDYRSDAPRMTPFAGTFTPDQQQQILIALNAHRGCSVAIRPSQGSEGAAISTSASKAAAEHLAGLFWKAGWDASIQELGADARSRGSRGLVIVVNPESPANGARSPIQAAQTLAEALKTMGIQTSKRNSNRVDPKQFELLVGVEVR
jgi:hypothetical protein